MEMTRSDLYFKNFSLVAVWLWIVAGEMEGGRCSEAILII